MLCVIEYSAKSLEVIVMTPLNRACMHPIVTMSLSFTVSEIFNVE